MRWTLGLVEDDDVILENYADFLEARGFGVRHFILCAALFLGCGDSPELTYGRAVCEAYADKCDESFTTCLDQWLIFAGHETRDVCADEYLTARRCQAEQDCAIPGVCGDLKPIDQLFVCAAQQPDPN